jgi:hypothetical protein
MSRSAGRDYAAAFADEHQYFVTETIAQIAAMDHGCHPLRTATANIICARRAGVAGRPMKRRAVLG